MASSEVEKGLADLGPELVNASTEEIISRTRLLENDIKVS